MRVYWRENEPTYGGVSWKRHLCKVLGHYDSGGHPHAVFCGRCGMVGFRLNDDATINTGYPNHGGSYVRGRAADGICTHSAGGHGPAGCFDLFAKSAGMIKGDDGRYRFAWEHLRWLGFKIDDAEAVRIGKVP